MIPFLALLLQGTLDGQVTADERPVANAQVRLRGAGLGALTDSAGRWRIAQAPAGEWVLEVRALGYAPATRPVRVDRGGTVRVDVALRPLPGALAPVVTTGTMKETFVDASPVKVDVITPKFLERNVSANLMDNLPFVNGLLQQVDCGVCFTNNIRINGMEGPYTAVLVDGMPVMSALASVYGLNGIDPALVEQIEILKGPSSTLYGSEAMGGVINVLTKDPRFAPRLSASAFVTSHGESSLALGAGATPSARTSMVMSGTLAYNDRFVDGNADGFGDLPRIARASLFAKGSVDDAGGARRLDLAARWWYERRLAGVRGFRWDDRGGTERYGESIRTDRVELLGSYRFPGERRPLRLDFAANRHDQNSVYGTQPYVARQSVLFGQLAWNALTTARHDLLLGASLRHQGYRDSTAAQRTRDDRVVAGVFAQDEVTVAPGWTVLGGVRLDHHDVHGVVTAPRLAVKWEADPHTTLRMNAATGFRVVNVFTEDHAALTGARRVEFAEALRPERSVTVTASLARVLDLRGIPDALTLDVDAFWTRFTNRILPDYDADPTLIVYRNLDGHAETRGVSAAAGYMTLRQPLFANLGVTWQDAAVVERGARRRIPFSPRVQGVWTLGWKFHDAGVTLDWTGRVQSPVRLPDLPGHPGRSRWVSEQHLQATTTLRAGMDVYAAVKNLLDWTQADPIVAPHDPFGEEFDTARVYGPVQGRRLLVGARWIVGR